MVRTIKRIGAFFFSFILIIPFAVSGQEVGIKFESGISWNDILSKARAENKFIFVDCYTTWCGPCKWMSKNIFPKKEVGDYFNAHFINVAMQMDSTSHDGDDIKARYNDVGQITKTYNVNSYPTYLFFSPDGKAVHYIVGATKTGEEFILAGENALNPEKQYFTMINLLEQHRTDSVFLYQALKNALKIQDSLNASRIEPLYMHFIHDPLTIENIKLMLAFIGVSGTSHSESFDCLQRNAQKINEIMGQTDFVQEELGGIVVYEELGPYFTKQLFPINWQVISSKIRLKYPLLGESLITIVGYQFRNYCRLEMRRIGDEQKGSKDLWNDVERKVKREINGVDLSLILMDERARYYSKKELWTNCANASFQLLKKYGDTLGKDHTNNICWDYIFKHCDNKKILNEAVKWMKYYIDQKSTDGECIDTYANLLYKLGEKDNAATWESMAIRLAEKDKDNPEDVKTFRGNLTKMEQGLPTW